MNVEAVARSGYGVLMPHDTPPRNLPEFAQMVERLGFDTLWIPENSFLAGGISAAALALGATRHLRIGIGVLPAPTRHPATMAMEIATLVDAYPGRLLPGIGLGVPAWVSRMGLMPSKPARFMSDYLLALRQLLDGDETTRTVDGSGFKLEQISLANPPVDRVPLAVGAVGELMLKLAGRAADAAIISTLASPEYVSWAVEVLSESAANAGRELPRRTCFVSTSIHDDPAEARTLIRPDLAFVLAAMGACALTKPLGIDEELQELLSGDEALSTSMPDRWVDQMGIAGTPDDFGARAQQYLDAGASDLILSPKPVGRTVDVLTRASEVLGLSKRAER